MIELFGYFSVILTDISAIAVDPLVNLNGRLTSRSRLTIYLKSGQNVEIEEPTVAVQQAYTQITTKLKRSKK